MSTETPVAVGVGEPVGVRTTPEPSPEATRRVSPRISLREVIAISVGAVILAVISTWPLALNLSTQITPDLGDPIRTAWQVAWEGHALLTNPAGIFNTNAFWPRLNSLTFSDTLLGYAPFGMLGSGSVAALIRYNLLYLFVWALPVVGAYLLARELGLRRAASVVAGVAFAYVPYKAGINGHLHVLSSGAIPLTFFLLLRGYRRSSVALIIAGWLVATWQLTLGYTLALPFLYTLMLFGLVIVVMLWHRRRTAGRATNRAEVSGASTGTHSTQAKRWVLTRGVIIASVLGIAVMGATEAMQTRHYVLTAKTYPLSQRPLETVADYSAGPHAWLSAPAENRVWGEITAPMRAKINSRGESMFFPGLTILLLGAVGLFATVFPLWLRVLLVGVAGAFALLALGLGLTGAGYPYRLLYDYAPGWKGFRVPGRGIVMTQLAMALMAGAGLHQLMSLRAKRGGRPIAIGCCSLCAALIVVEASAKQPLLTVPKTPLVLTRLQGPQFHLPTAPATDRLYQFWSTDGYPAIANGVSTFELTAQGALRGTMKNFPDQLSVDMLRNAGIRTVVLHTDLVNRGLPIDREYFLEPRDLKRAATTPISKFPITRRRVGSDIIYTIKEGRRPRDDS